MRRTEVEEMQSAISRMKIGKASGPSGVAVEMLKAVWMFEIFEKHI